MNLDDAVGGLYQALSAGIPPDNAIEFLRTSGKAAVAGVSNIETAVDGISSVLNAYSMGMQGTGKISDLFFETVRLGKTTFDELAQNIGKVAPIANSAGVGIDQLFGAYATLTKQGIKTDEATTGNPSDDNSNC